MNESAGRKAPRKAPAGTVRRTAPQDRSVRRPASARQATRSQPQRTRPTESVRSQPERPARPRQQTVSHQTARAAQKHSEKKMGWFKRLARFFTRELTGGEKDTNKYPLFYRKKELAPVSVAFVATLGVLLIFGLVILFSASYATAYYKFKDSYHYIKPQVIYACLGLGIMWVLSRMDYHWIRKFNIIAYVGVVILLGIVLTMEPIKGCRRWINLPHIPTLQVSEIAKFSMILMTAVIFEYYRNKLDREIPTFWLPLALLGPVVLLLYLEPHNSAIVLTGLIVGSMMIAGGCKWKFLITRGAVLGALAVAAIMSRKGYVEDRLSGWGDPFSDMKGSTLQTGQSLYTIGSGGLFGVGIGNSVQKHNWLPEAPNDFIFSILCEELGFVGALACIILFVMLIAQGIMIAINAPDRFGFLLTFGTIVQIGLQFMFNVAVVTGLAPNTGISLPFFSSGGTSMVILLAQMGFVLSVNRAGNRRRQEMQEAEEEEKEKKRQVRTLRVASRNDS